MLKNVQRQNLRSQQTAPPLTPAATLLRKQCVLALIIGLHLLAVLVWLHDKRPRVEQRPTFISILLPAAAKATAPSLDQADPSPHRDPIAVPVRTLPAHDIPPPDAGADRPADVPDAASPAPATSTGPGFSMDLVRRETSRVARSIAHEMPSMPSGADSRWGRFERDVDAAHFGAGVWQDSYTAPDGTIIYRKHVGGRTICRMSGNVGPENGIIKGVDEAGSVACPTTAQWKREP
jgi:hypothetical protein